MQDVIQHSSGIVLSARTFRPLWIFPWTCSVWRQFPLRTGIATIAFVNKQAAQQGHSEIVKLLGELQLSPDMQELFTALESYAKRQSEHGVKSYRIYAGHEVEGKVQVEITPERNESD